VTLDFEQLQLAEPYDGSDTIAMGDGSGLQIDNIGSLSLQTPTYTLHLSQVLHCPTAIAKLLSINQFCEDNNWFFILTDSHYFTKDKQTGLTLLEGKSDGGLYPIHTTTTALNKARIHKAMLGIKAYTSVWHSRLGHPSFTVVHAVLIQHSLPVLGSLHNKEFCEPCQLGKSKQLPFPLSSRISLAPLWLIHTDVWSSPVPSLEGYKYYVIFIYDFSRFSWLYPLKTKADVFISFMKFKALVEYLFSSTIKHL